ncbi:type 1 glutamine amidotransferase [Kaarinaea lacus]
MKPVAIFRHLKCEGPGYFANFLHKHHLDYSLIRIDQDDAIPSSIDDFSALVFMGGPMSVNDDLPWIDKELSLIRSAAENKLPVLGHCLGGQLICKALGGKVSANRVREIGWHPVQKLDNPSANKWLSNLPDEFDAFHWHGETFSIPDGATPILKSEFCEHQAFTIDNILALQCHVEMTSEMVMEWAKEYAHELSNPSQSIQSASDMITRIEVKTKALNQTADKLYQQWATPLLR